MAIRSRTTGVMLRRFLLLGGLAVLMCGGAPAARAGLDVNLGAAISLDDDVSIFLGVSGRFFDAKPDAVKRVYRKTRNPEDVAVAYFLARRGGVSVRVVLGHRERGLSWFRVGLQLGLPIDVYFMPMDHHPGPPYGKAYGYWKKQRGRHGHPRGLTDVEVRDLVVLHLASGYYGLAPGEVARRRAGQGAVVVVAGEYRHRHGPGQGPPGKAGSSSPGKAKGKSKVKVKGKS